MGHHSTGPGSKNIESQGLILREPLSSKHRLPGEVRDECQSDGNCVVLDPLTTEKKARDRLGLNDRDELADGENVQTLQQIAVSEAIRLADACQQPMMTGLLDLAENGSGRLADAIEVANRLVQVADRTRDDLDQGLRNIQAEQESVLADIARHAEASEVSVQIDTDAKWVELRVMDNGKGLTPVDPQDPMSLGILGVSERARSMGGEFTTAGRPGRGAVAVARIPVRGDCDESPVG